MGHACNHTSGLGSKDRRCGFEANLSYLEDPSENKTKQKQTSNRTEPGSAHL